MVKIRGGCLEVCRLGVLRWDRKSTARTAGVMLCRAKVRQFELRPLLVSGPPIDHSRFGSPLKRHTPSAGLRMRRDLAGKGGSTANIA